MLELKLTVNDLVHMLRLFSSEGEWRRFFS